MTGRSSAWVACVVRDDPRRSWSVITSRYSAGRGRDRSRPTLRPLRVAGRAAGGSTTEPSCSGDDEVDLGRARARRGRARARAAACRGDRGRRGCGRRGIGRPRVRSRRGRGRRRRGRARRRWWPRAPDRAGSGPSGRRPCVPSGTCLVAARGERQRDVELVTAAIGIERRAAAGRMRGPGRRARASPAAGDGRRCRRVVPVAPARTWVELTPLRHERAVEAARRAGRGRGAR